MEHLYHIFSKILNMSITAGIVICMVLLMRILLRRAPKIFSYLLWSVVLFRLLCPIALSSSFSALRIWETPAAETETTSFLSQTVPNDTVILPVPDNFANDVPPDASPAQTQSELSKTAVTDSKATILKKLIFLIFSYIWLFGIVLMTGYGVISTLLLKKRLAGSYYIEENIYITDSVDTPFTMGFLSPKIYLPEFLSDREKEFIILHEQTHIRRGDHIIKLLAFFALTIHWFNPLVWIAVITAEKDMEMSCDETVMKKMNEDIRTEYSTSLLCLATGKRIIRGTPLAFGEGNTKSRIKNIMRYKKPAAIIVCIAAVLVGVCIIGFGTNPKQTEENSNTSESDTETETLSEISTSEASASETFTPETFADNWGRAFCERNGEKIAAMSTAETKENLKEHAFFEEVNGSYQLGVSSPWPWNGDTDYRIVDISDTHVEILYYARTSDPHVTVWRESLELIQENDVFLAASEQLEIFDAIRSEEEFGRAYPNGISNTPMDYLWDDTAESLNQNTLLSSSWIYKTLADPAKAAIYLLNLSEKTKATVIDSSDSISEENLVSFATVNLEFPDGSQTTIRMIQPFNENFDGRGIWIPQDDTKDFYSKKTLPENNLYSGYSYLGTYGDTGNPLYDEYRNSRKERVIYSVTADVTHDGIEDRIDSIISDEDISGSPFEIMSGIGTAYIKVYPGKEDGSFSDTAVFVSLEIADTHVGNGQIGLVKKDGLSYLLISNMYEIQGSADYSFVIFYIDTKRKAAACIDEDSIGFSISEEQTDSPLPTESSKREDVIPAFREHLQPWLTDAILFVSCDVSDIPESIHLSLPNEEYRALDYYERVWKNRPLAEE